MTFPLTAARAALVTASAVAGASCISPVERGTTERTSSASQAVIGGSADTSDLAVVALVQASTGNLCSGTLVAPTLVLTAAHCVKGIQASDLQVLLGPTTASPTQTVAVTSAVAYPTYDSEDDGIPGGVDLGFVTLASALSVTPVTIRTDTTDAELTGADVTVVGFGVDDGTDNSGSGTRRSVTLSVSKLCSRFFQAGGEDANACVGDSGGAVLLGGQLVGTVSGGNNGCFAPTTFMRTVARDVSVLVHLARSVVRRGDGDEGRGVRRCRISCGRRWQHDGDAHGARWLRGRCEPRARGPTVALVRRLRRVGRRPEAPAGSVTMS